VLSTFTGAGLSDRGFRQDFCVVSAGDALWGQPIEEFTGVPGVFTGVIGGPPCQKDSKANRTNRDPAAGLVLKREFFRVVAECAPEWFLMEGVNGMADVSALVPPGYTLQRLHFNAQALGFAQFRDRWFLFGYRRGAPLVIPYVTPRARSAAGQSRCCIASEFERDGDEARSWPDFCELQGLPRDFDFPKGLSVKLRYRLVGNGWHVGVARVLAGVIRARGVTVPGQLCVCECGRLTSGALHATVSCRKRMQRRRDAAGVTKPGPVTSGSSLELTLL